LREERKMADKKRVAWNKDRTNSVVLTKLKEFSISEAIHPDPRSDNKIKKFEVRGWFNLENSFMFGTFPTRTEAEMFLEAIHEMYP
jgi:hypothetical protein